MNNKTNAIIYQLALRTFTPEGTLRAAASLLPHIASLGVDILYVCPFFAEEEDTDRITWSERQKKSKTNNPKNPYKIADYFNVDPEFGTNEDLKIFVRKAHENSLLVMFDLVYLHCGRSAVFIKEYPDFVIRNEDGTVWIADIWPFARLNYQNVELRKYLLQNMQTLLDEFECDGFRCDVGDSVPLDFWRDSFAKLKERHADLVTLNEGINPEYIQEVFDMGYKYDWNRLMIDIFANDMPAYELKNTYEKEKMQYGENIVKLIRTIDTHDVASDAGLNRNEIIMTSKGVEAALVITNTYDGVSFLWNGYELCDDAENNMFSNRFYGKRSAMNWSKAFTEDGIRRAGFIKEIHRLHHACDAIVNGRIHWVGNSSPKEVVSYVKASDKQQLLIVVNTKNACVNATVNADISNAKTIMQSGLADDSLLNKTLSFKPYGYLIAELG